MFILLSICVQKSANLYAHRSVSISPGTLLSDLILRDRVSNTQLSNMDFFYADMVGVYSFGE